MNHTTHFAHPELVEGRMTGKKNIFLSIVTCMILCAGSCSNAMNIFDAIFNGDFEKVKKLVQVDKVDVNVRDPDGETPLWLACERNNHEIVSLLLENGAKESVNTAGKLVNHTPLWLACHNNNFEIIRLLLQYGAFVDQESLQEAHNRPEILRYLNLAKDYDDSPDKLKFINYRDEFDLLKERARIKDHTGLNALVMINNMHKQQKSTENELFKKFQDLRIITQKWDALNIFEAVGNGDFEAVKKLVEVDKVDINKFYYYEHNPLWWACLYGNLEIIKLLLNNGAKDSIDFPDKYGCTPLYNVCQRANFEAVKLLLENGAEIDEKSLAYAQYYSDSNAVKHFALLVEGIFGVDQETTTQRFDKRSQVLKAITLLPLKSLEQLDKAMFTNLFYQLIVSEYLELVKVYDNAQNKKQFVWNTLRSNEILFKFLTRRAFNKDNISFTGEIDMIKKLQEQQKLATGKYKKLRDLRIITQQW